MSNTFPAKPDSILVYDDGRSIEISGEELDAVYSVFAGADETVGIWYASTYVGNGYGISTVSKSTCVELRYNRRQKFVRDQDKPVDDFPFGVMASVYYNNREYDAILFTWGEDFHGNNDVHAFPLTDGLYDYWHGESGGWGWSTTSEKIVTLTAYVEELLKK